MLNLMSYVPDIFSTSYRNERMPAKRKGKGRGTEKERKEEKETA